MTYSEDAAGNPAPVNKSSEDYGTYIHSSGGMSLRDWFAGQALAGWLASFVNDRQHPVMRAIDDEVAQYSYSMADAMLKARNAKE